MSAMANNNDKDLAQFEQALKKQSEDKLEFLLAHTDANLEQGRYKAIEKELESRRAGNPPSAPGINAPSKPIPTAQPKVPSPGLGKPLGSHGSMPSIQPPSESPSTRRSLLKRREESAPIPEPEMQEPPRKSLKIKNYRTQATLNSSDDDDMPMMARPQGGGFFMAMLVVAMILIASSAGILSIMLFDLPGKAEISDTVFMVGNHAAALADKVMALVNKG